jgi:putative tryptophan/tyrosine transport system substrate-binding protein
LNLEDCRVKRREFIAGLGGATTWPFARLFAAEAQRRVGALLNITYNDRRYYAQSILGALREGLAASGWVEGHNLGIDYRFAGSDPGRLAAYAEELVNLRPDVIFALTGPAVRAIQQRTSAIPIVFVGGGDPTSTGLVRNIARPEGNVTGFANTFGSLGGRWLELFKEAVPRLTRVADVFPANAFDPANAIDDGGGPRAIIAATAAQLGVTIIRMPVHNAVEIEPAITAFAAEPDGGLLLTGGISLATVAAIGRLALYHNLPMMFGGAPGLTEGTLMAHGSDGLDLVRRASSYIDRILRGAKPSELPIQYPTKFELVVNLKTAKAIGVTIPEAFLALADEVIE